MRKLSTAFLATLGWLTTQGCVFLHDDACRTNADCKSGRVCDDGTCTGGSVDGGEQPSGNGNNNVANSCITDNGISYLDGRAKKARPEICTHAPAGTVTATVRTGYNYGRELGAPNSLTVKLSGGDVLSVDGVACEPMYPNQLAQEVNEEDCPQYFMCGGCCAWELTVGGVLEGATSLPDTAYWSITAHPSYCPGKFSGNEYFIGGYPYEGPAPGGGTGGSSSGGSGCGAYQSCEGCYGQCNDDCYDYPMGCIGPCYQACDKCCTP